MKFKKLSLDESLFEDNLNWVPAPHDPNVLVIGASDYDDEFVAAELPEEDMQGPESGSDAGVTDLLISAINDEWSTIRSYNSLIETLKYESANNPDYAAFIQILNEINAEENKHVGQLQEILAKLSPNAQYIDRGREEGRSQFHFTNGQLQVESWQTTKAPQVATDTVSGDDVCTLTDVDDDI